MLVLLDLIFTFHRRKRQQPEIEANAGRILALLLRTHFVPTEGNLPFINIMLELPGALHFQKRFGLLALQCGK